VLRRRTWAKGFVLVPPCHPGQPVAIARTAVPRICIGALWYGKPRLTSAWGAASRRVWRAQVQCARLALRKTAILRFDVRRGGHRRASPERVTDTAGARLGIEQILARRTPVSDRQDAVDAAVDLTPSGPINSW